MKHLLLPILLTAALHSFSQTHPSADIDINNYRARFYSNGLISTDGNDYHFAIPKDSNTHALFSGSLYVGAFDQQFGVLHLSYARYDNVKTNFRFGPIASAYGTNYTNRYNKVWKINRSEIINHVQHYASPGYVVPPSIADWPANGNVSNGEPAQLAPYADLNGNGVYEPASGEYPIIKGEQALYIIFSDRANPDNIHLGTPLKVDIHMMVYAFGNTYATRLQNTLFVNYKIVNRSPNDYRDMLVGLFNDFDLGNFSNDRVGCDTPSHSFYVYNDMLPELSTGGYGYVNSSLGVTLLNQNLYSFMYETNGSSFSPQDPIDYNTQILAFHKYNVMNAIWRDGTPLTVGGNGYGGTVPTRYAFPSHSCDFSSAQWSDYTSLHPYNDRRALGTAGKFTMPVGASVCLDIAYVYAESTDTVNCMTNVVDTLLHNIAHIRNFYNNTPNTCNDLVSGIETPADEPFRFFPNPITGYLHVSFTEPKLRKVMLRDMQGRVVQEVSTIETQLSINTENLANGTYVLAIDHSGRVVSRSLVVKQ